MDRVFGNPGTTELPYLAALAEAEDVPEYVLGVHEGAVVSMADGYARATRRPAFVSLRIAVLPHLKAVGWGRIVNITPAAVLTAPPTMVAYVSSKAGLIGLTRTLASALGTYGITVNAIAPSMVRTATAERTVGADGGFERVLVQQAVPRTPGAVLPRPDPPERGRRGQRLLTGQTLNVAGGSAYL